MPSSDRFAKADVPVPRVLIVDDDANVMLTMKALLELDFQVQACDSAESALDMLGRKAFDVLCTDHSMPGLTGLELIQAVEERQILLGVVLVTGRYEEFVNDRVSRDGPNAAPVSILTKPYQPEDLIAAVRRADTFARMKRALRGINMPLRGTTV